MLVFSHEEVFHQIGKQTLIDGLVELELRIINAYNLGELHIQSNRNWKDFIQNPARPGRQIKKQRAPKQSFRAQMRSVNRNR